MSAYSMKLVALVVIQAWAGAALGAPPPRVVPLETVVRSADAVFRGEVVYAKKVGDKYIYGVVSNSFISGETKKKCIQSKQGFALGVEYVFMVGEGDGDCLGGGDFFRRGLEVKSYDGVDYVLLNDEKYMYPREFIDRFSMNSQVMDSDSFISLWSGVEINKFLGYIKGHRQ